MRRTRLAAPPSGAAPSGRRPMIRRRVQELGSRCCLRCGWAHSVPRRRAAPGRSLDPVDRARLSAVAGGVLIGTFVGDAAAARWEGAPAVDLRGARARLDESLAAKTLAYTDDTQLTLALAEHLCLEPTVEPQSLTRTFLEHFEEHRGYARGMFGIVDAWRRGVDPESAARSVFPAGSFGNGAAMRVAPVGVIWSGERAVRAAHRQAALTHAHPVGMDAAAAQALAVARAAATGAFTLSDLAVVLDGCQTDPMRAGLARACEETLARRPLPEVAQVVGTDVLADQSVPAALWVAATAEDIPHATLLALALGGDTDTIAAMACAVLGAAQGGESVPAAWTVRLEDGPRGRTYAVELAARLAAVAADVSSGAG
ncbi:MAG: hypothetical protein GEU74_00830 [Nitriliruptorales bacterium]|nr:hypothetical protein [Nitriliruptorales bacterium]